MTLSWNTPRPHNITPLISSKITCLSEITIAFDLPLPLFAIIPLDELLILSYGMMVNCTYLLLKHGACVVYYTDIFGWQTKCHMARSPPP